MQSTRMFDQSCKNDEILSTEVAVKSTLSFMSFHMSSQIVLKESLVPTFVTRGEIILVCGMYISLVVP